MTRHGPALLALSVLAIASWTYNVNYDTRAALDRLNALRAEIAGERENLQVLRVEWAYLNAPERLSRLVEEHREALALVPLTPEALGYVAAVAFPPQETPDFVPKPPSELMVAAAPSVPAGDAGTGDAGPAEIAAPEDHGSAVASAALVAAPEDAAAPGPGRESSEEMALASAEAAVPAETAGSAAGEVVARKSQGVGTEELRAAITAALIEAGVPVQQEKAVAVVPASAAPGAPMPQARPVDWAGR